MHNIPQKHLLNRLAHLFKQVQVRISLKHLLVAQPLIRMSSGQLFPIYSLDDYSVGHSFSGWKTTALLLDQSHHVV